MANITYRAPKRRIEKCVSWISENVTNVALGADNILFAADDSCTLVRSIVELDITALQGDANVGLLLAKAPTGVLVSHARVTTILDRRPPMEELATTWKAAPVVGNVYHVSMDLKSMRKLKKDDEIILNMICNLNAGVNVRGTVTLFFKE